MLLINPLECYWQLGNLLTAAHPKKGKTFQAELSWGRRQLNSQRNGHFLVMSAQLFNLYISLTYFCILICICIFIRICFSICICWGVSQYFARFLPLCVCQLNCSTVKSVVGSQGSTHARIRDYANKTILPRQQKLIMTYPGTKQLHRGCTEMSLRKRWMLKAGEQGIGELRDTWCTKMDVFFWKKSK